MKPATPENETRRLESLYQLNILDTAAEDAFDALTQLATMICGVPISVISLIDIDRQWFKSKQGISDDQTARDVSFCAHAILQPNKILHVADATLDPRFADNPQVMAENGIRFYAGVPLTLDEGLALGTLCVVDTVSKNLTQQQLTALQLLANQVTKLLEARKLALDNQYKSMLLQQSEQRYRSMLENLPGVVFRCQNDDSWSMLFISDHVAELTGYAASEFIDNAQISFEHITFSEDSPRLHQTVQQALQLKQGYDVEYRIHTRYGQIKWLQELGRGIYDENDRLLFLDGFIWDISGRKEVELLKSQFVSVVSHELRTPLTSIRGSLGLLLGGVAGELTPTVQQMLLIASENSDRLTQLINDLLDIEKLMAGKMTLYPIMLQARELIRQSLAQNKPFADTHDCQLELMPGEDVSLYVDKMRLEQVLSNLLSNAAKFSPPQTVIRISLATTASGWAEIAVTDQGPGIADSFKDKIFQKFSQAEAADSRAKGGTGLGLAICKELLEAMQGQIGYQNLADGCRFFIRLPVKSPQE